MATPGSHRIAPGTRLGRYRVDRLLGHGGVASVYEAEDPSGRSVAIKVLHPFLADDPLILARFEREARAAQMVTHPHVVRILEVGFEEGGAPFLVMERVHGETLARTLRAGPWEVRRACRVVGQVLDALDAVHRLGIVHRDLKPANVLLTDGDFVKVFDFGIAAVARASPDLTPAGRAMGTPHYASPEQLSGRCRDDPRSDLYAVGVLLYELLCGSRPFVAEPFVELCRQVLEDEPPPMAAFRKDVPPALEAVIRRAMAKRPEERPPEARAFQEALVPFGGKPLLGCAGARESG